MQANTLAFDALILAGGRSSRLGGVPKQTLVFRGKTLLEWALAAASGAWRTVVVGDAGLPGVTAAPVPGTAPPAAVLSCREEPPFSGPAAAIAAGLETLANNGGGSPVTLVLACDMPLSAQAVAALRHALAATPVEAARVRSVMAAAEDGRPQPLAAFYNTAELTHACRELAARNALANGSVRALLANLDVQLVTVPAGSTSDVDTWDDAAALGMAAGNQRGSQDRRTGDTNVGGNS